MDCFGLYNVCFMILLDGKVWRIYFNKLLFMRVWFMLYNIKVFVNNKNLEMLWIKWKFNGNI